MAHAAADTPASHRGVPQDFICPITQEIMTDPVTTVDGNAYERLAIEAWFATGRITSPLTNARLGSRALTPNLTLKRAVSDFLATNGVHLADAHRQANEVRDLKVCLQLRERDLEAAQAKSSVMVDRTEHERVLLLLQRTQRELAETRTALATAKTPAAAAAAAIASPAASLATNASGRGNLSPPFGSVGVSSISNGGIGEHGSVRSDRDNCDASPPHEMDETPVPPPDEDNSRSTRAPLYQVTSSSSSLASLSTSTSLIEGEQCASGGGGGAAQEVEARENVDVSLHELELHSASWGKTLSPSRENNSFAVGTASPLHVPASVDSPAQRQSASTASHPFLDGNGGGGAEPTARDLPWNNLSRGASSSSSSSSSSTHVLGEQSVALERAAADARAEAARHDAEAHRMAAIASSCSDESATATQASEQARARAREARSIALAAKQDMQRQQELQDSVGAKYCAGMVELGVKSEAEALQDLAAVRSGSGEVPIRGALLEAYLEAKHASDTAQQALQAAQTLACAAEVEADQQEQVSVACDAKKEAAELEQLACSAAAKEARQRAAQADARLLKLREASAEAEAAVAWCVSASGGTLVPSPENTPLLLVLHALRKSMKAVPARILRERDGATAGELRRAGYSLEDLKAAGFSILQLGLPPKMMPLLNSNSHAYAPGEDAPLEDRSNTNRGRNAAMNSEEEHKNSVYEEEPEHLANSSSSLSGLVRNSRSSSSSGSLLRQESRSVSGGGSLDNDALESGENAGRGSAATVSDSHSGQPASAADPFVAADARARMDPSSFGGWSVHDLWVGDDHDSRCWLLSQLAIAIRTRDAPCLVAILLVAQYGCENGGDGSDATDGSSSSDINISDGSDSNSSNATVEPPTVLLLRVLKEVYDLMGEGGIDSPNACSIRQSLSEHGLGDVIVGLLQTQMILPRVQHQAAGIVARLAYDDDESRSSCLMSMGVAEVLIESLQKHVNHAGVQQWGLMSMGNLCNASEPRKRALMSLGLGPSLVHALRTHGDSPGVQQWGLMAAGNLSNGSGDRKAELVELGVGEVLASALRNHASHPGVQQWGLMAAGLLSNGSETRSAHLLELGVGDSLMAALRAHRRSPGVQQWALSAAGNLICNHDGRAGELMRQGLGDSLLSAFTLHSTNGGVQEQAMKVAGNLSYENDERTSYLVAAGVVDLVVAAMKLHGARRGVQFRGCIALYFLAKYGGHSTRALLRDAKAAAAQVRTARDAHSSDNNGVVYWANYALSQFS